ncbi:vps16 [[Candida] subhashii]|uniref:Vps16 n=1 Tax=[Candida] subhashii TaxID=561895 RepID=A0A8J5QGN6_9ASCO|nr:vps16 [[Candida] subhashii]KAG7660788.1 vps16 [[Candida] subhashii]
MPHSTNHNPSYNWSKLSNVYYTIQTCYDSINWSLESLYYNYNLKLSPNSTLVAISGKHSQYPNLIDVYSIGGNKLYSIVYNNTIVEHIHSYLFRNECLILVFNNGKFRYYYDLSGCLFNQYDMLQDITHMDNVGSISQQPQDHHHHQQTIITNLENNEIEIPINIIECKIINHRYLVTRMIGKFIITDLDTFINYEIPLTSLNSSNIHTFTSQPTTKQDSIILHILYQNTIITINIDIGLASYEFINQQLTDGPFNSISSSPNGQLITLFNAQMKKIFVVNNTFDQVLLDYDTINESGPPYQIEWCGNDAIILSFKDEIKLIGPPGQQSISFFYDLIDDDDENEPQSDFDLENLLTKQDEDLSFTIPILQTSIDGVRILTDHKLQFLSRVPQTTIDLYQIGSDHPSSILIDCVDKFAEYASKADTNVSLLKHDGTLLKAMEGCLEVALDEFNPIWQKKLLSAVSFGKIYYDGDDDEDGQYFDSEKYLSILNNIKVLNQLRSIEIGLFLTHKEIENVGWESIIRMLISRNHHFLGLKIIDLLNLPNLKPIIYIHWCCAKIKRELTMSDIELFKIISKKLISLNGDQYNYISVGEISDVAHEEGRNMLCKLLINLEPSMIKKVMELLKFEEPELALLKCFQSGDYDLCKILLLYLQDNLSMSQFFRVLNQNEQTGHDASVDELRELGIKIRSESMVITGDVIGNMWVKSIGKYDKSSGLLESYLHQENKTHELVVTKLKSISPPQSSSPDHEPQPHELEEYYSTYKQTLTKALSKRSQHRQSKSIHRQLAILDLQKRLTETYLTNFYIHKSLTAILSHLIGKLNQLKPAQKIAKEFQISQEKFHQIVIGAYAPTKQFDHLYEFAMAGPPPVGYEPYVDAGFRYGAPAVHLSNYIKKCTKYDPGQKMRLFAKNRDWEMAGLEGFRIKDIGMLRDLLELVGDDDGDGREIVRGYIEKLGYSL